MGLFRWLTSRAEDDGLSFRCNICGKGARAPVERLDREQQTCRCGSSVRQRALMHILSMELFGDSLAIPDFPVRREIVGLDMSGAGNYASRLAKKLGYTNTFLHKSPRLDITSPESAWLGRCDFVISSDVFEHVPPPVDRAFANTFQLLHPGGLFLLTVPYTLEPLTLEHFPDLHEYRIATKGDRRLLINKTVDGRIQEFDDLVFHGGEGLTLEMRVFSELDIKEKLRQAGFVDIRIHGENFSQFGILWPQQWSLPISARRPAE